jgi:hypothetical protein
MDVLAGQEAGFGPATVTWEGLAAWCALTGETPEPWEARTLVRLGVLRANILSEEKPGDRSNKN